MNLASALIKQIIVHEDVETWSALKENYLPGEFQPLFRIVDKHLDNYRSLPSFEDLHYSIRDRVLEEKLIAIESVEVDIDPWQLLEYLKNEYAQVLILDELDKYVDTSIAMSTAEENIEFIQGIIAVVENKIDLEKPGESLQSIDLFDSEEELAQYVPLGLNHDFDLEYKFSPIEYVLVGGPRGSGKSLTCMNLSNYVRDQLKRSSLYYTIEMDIRQTMQRHCAQSLDIKAKDIKFRDLTRSEWDRVATWWANRFQEGDQHLEEFRKTRDFETLHHKLRKLPLSEQERLDIVYEPQLSLAKLRSDLDIKFSSGVDYGIIVVDYINQVKRDRRGWNAGQYDWTEQIEVSKALSEIAKEYQCMVFSAYQTDMDGQARFSKGILDSCDAAFSLNAWEHEDNCMSFTCQKIRNDSPTSFTSEINWDTLRIGPKTVLSPAEKKAIKGDFKKEEEEIDDI